MHIVSQGPEATEAWARSLSLFAKPGLVVLLKGDLGAGKSTFARAFIKALAIDEKDFDVPSPTFTLVQTYDDLRVAVAHVDLYRLGTTGDLAELGLEELAKTHLLLIEWPQDNCEKLSVDRLHLNLSGSGTNRDIELVAHGAWAKVLQRNAEIETFLNAQNITLTSRRFFEGDASARRYEKVQSKTVTLILMDMPQRPDGPPVKNDRPYSAIAHLAEGLREVVAVNDQLLKMNYSAPRIMACDLNQGLALIEDLGLQVYGQMIGAGVDMAEPVHAAIDLLADMASRVWPRQVPVRGAGIYAMPSYDEEAQLIEVDLLPVWFHAHLHRREAPESLRQSFAALWREVLPFTKVEPAVWVLRDFHSPNLLWLPEREAMRRVGLIDTQDAVLGHPAYDLASLLQDARVDVEFAFANQLYLRYENQRKKRGAFDAEEFARVYAILGAQRASKILGIFARLNARDGKPQYLKHMPRVSRYLARNLEHPALSKIKHWYLHEMPEALDIGKNAMSEKPDTSMIMAAGLGLRMRPLTLTTPKPLIKVAGKALIDYAVEKLKVAGIESVVVNKHYLPDQIEAWAKTQRGIKIKTSDESDQVLETGGGITRALPMLGNKSFYVLNSDCFWTEGQTPALQRLSETWDDRKMDSLLLLCDPARTTGYHGDGDFVIESDGRLKRQTQNALVYIGAYIVHPRLFEAAPIGAFSMNVLWNKAIAAGRLYGIEHQGYWFDVGTPEGIPAAEAGLVKKLNMDKRGPQVFNIAAGANFLEILADQVLARFPTGEAPRPLSDWTILLPSRRAAQAFSEILLARSKKNALILPRIKPIGDLDEDRLQDEMVGDDLPQAMPAIATMLELTRLAKSWATAHPEIALAKAISASPVQALNLARSLNEIIITSETHGLSVADFTKLYDLDIAEHRQTITSLLELVLKDLPALQAAEGKMGSTARRSAMIRAEARRIAEGGHSGPIIAAGSTGSIPATRELLAAIANHPEGAVILPGLDFIADEESWAAIKPEHPQFALKALLAEFQIERKDVETLGSKVSSRNLLASELFRPTETTPRWHNSLPLMREELATAVTGITEIAAPDRHLEARVIALIMRETLERPNKTAALVTPDRDLAQRLVAELKRWNIQVFDSAGEPLSRRGLGAALDLLLQIPLDDIAPAKLFAFLRHPLVSFGLDPSTYPRLVQLFELTVLRGPMVMLESYEAMLLHAQAKAVADRHLHPAVKGVTPGDWPALRTLAKTIDQLLGLLVHNGIGLAVHLNAYEQALHFAIAEQAWAETSSGLLDLLDELKTESQRWPDVSADETAILLRQLLQSQTQPPTDDGHPRLAILGTIEARLLPYDVMILGGLNESVWPKGADPGPWLNRNMRQELNLPMPERDIGMAAHDFEQGFCASEVYLTWSKRINHAPFAPSRWLLRMKAVLGASGVTAPEAGNCLALAQHLYASETSRQIQMPNFAPPISARPVEFSVTEVETLIRNPYAIYAKKILKLEPVADFAERPDAGLRGSLFHEAIGKWNEKQAPDLEALRLEGEIVLASLGSAEERYFWRKHFGRLSEFLWAEQAQLREELVKIFAEQRGETTFKVAGIEHILSARADRIDILNNHTARIIDYKTGEIPSTDQVKANFSPQLTLQAAMLLDGAFSFKPKAVAELIYFQIGGGQNGLKKKIAVEGGAIVIAELAQKHWAGFINLLASYQNPNQPYLPRLSVKEEEKPQDYDHLSRYLEWQLAEQES